MTAALHEFSGAWLTTMRSAAGLTIADVAGILRINGMGRRNPWFRWDIEPTLRAIEAGKRLPSPEQLLTLVPIFDFNLAEYRRLVEAETAKAAETAHV